VSDIKRGRAARNAKLASIPVGLAGRAALGLGKRLTGKSKDEVTAELMEKAANQLFTVLGELKGGAMKVGQALSVMEAAVPEQFGEPYREALTKLQKDAPPLPAAKVHRVLDAQLGTKWRERFSSFDDTPVASASIGQVHKGIWSDGRQVAVKVQYPGADEALRADLKTMQRMVSILKQLTPGADVQGVVDELIDRTEMELDYRLEADNQRAFAKAYEGHPHFVVPHVVASAPKVMITEWIDGIPMSQIIRSGTVEQRDICGTRLFELTFDAPARVGMMHGDAHPGNFMLLPDGKMGVIDFGAVAPLPDGLPVELGMTIRLARARDYEQLLPTMEKIGFIQKGEVVPPAEIDDMLRQYVEPMQVETFHYTRKWLQQMVKVDMDRSVQQIKTARQMDLPAKLAIPLRVIASSVAICAQLDAHIPVSGLAVQLIPGFEEPEPEPA
jgi:predicted unusual protein kinase regulating ubiquinone biosynthesis (AarF/ABC1/UbiB family)